VIGDYVGGPNHVLPTGRTARFASGLAVFDFLKRTTLLGCSAGSFAELGPAAATLARAEGLAGHARAVERRLVAPKPA
jgi:histidinol dehydrogenase